MKPARDGRFIFFEPWSLGDVIIAAAALRELSEPAALACHPSWHALLRCALAEKPDLDLIAIDLPYTRRNRVHPFESGPDAAGLATSEPTTVLSIRGDFRDLAAAHKLLPKARVRMNGWLRFFGRKSAIVNFPFAVGLCPVENRYRSWARLAGVAYSQIEATYRRKQAQAATTNRVAIHIGAQWRSKQYPDVSDLRDALGELGVSVRILAGPGDLRPRGVSENEVTRVADEALVEELRSARHVITNDSGPMHVAAFLGCRTVAVVRTSPIEEWAPPATEIVRSPETPRGYRPDRRYMSDEVLPGWPSPSSVLEKMRIQLARH
ncbi:MAG: glycosyltransferase family 9 protein [Chthoniobacterales bacterium]